MRWSRNSVAWPPPNIASICEGLRKPSQLPNRSTFKSLSPPCEGCEHFRAPANDVIDFIFFVWLLWVRSTCCQYVNPHTERRNPQEFTIELAELCAFGGNARQIVESLGGHSFLEVSNGEFN